MCDGRSARLPAPLRAGCRLVFTAHSVPLAMAEQSRYRDATHAVVTTRRERVESRTGRSCIRAAAGGQRIRGSSRTSRFLRQEAQRDGLRAVGALAQSGSSATTSKCSYRPRSRGPPRSGEIEFEMASGAAGSQRRSTFLDMMANVDDVNRRYERGRPCVNRPAKPDTTG